MKHLVAGLVLLLLATPSFALNIEREKQLCASKGEVAQYIMSHRQIGTPKEEILEKIRREGSFNQQNLAAIDQVVDMIYETPVHEDAFDRLKATQEIKVGVYNSCIQKIEVAPAK